MKLKIEDWMKIKGQILWHWITTIDNRVGYSICGREFRIVPPTRETMSFRRCKYCEKKLATLKSIKENI